jgi:hypothetical protein
MEFITPPKSDQTEQPVLANNMVENSSEQKTEESTQDASQFLFGTLE